MLSSLLNRRDTLTLLAAAGATLSLPAGAQEQPKRGGTLVVGSTQVPRHLNGAVQSGHCIKLTGDPPSPINPPPGCRFAGRCPVAEPACAAELPPLRELAPGHWVRCRRVDLIDGVPRAPLQLPTD
jgi:oligopeptide/dipeptide ABC transporter ATP-binding protein